jgi:hypothetical protein
VAADAAPDFEISSSVNNRSGDPPATGSGGLVAGVRAKRARDGARPSQGRMP